MTEPESAAEMLRQKLGILNDFLQLTQQALLLVNLEDLPPLLERKDGLIREIQLIDEALALHPSPAPEEASLREEMAEVVRGILENERTLEVRLEAEHTQLRREMRDFDQETRLKQYLERAKTKGGTVNLKS